MAIIAKPDSSSDVVAVAFSFALDMWSRRQDRPSGELDEGLRYWNLAPQFVRHLGHLAESILSAE